ncbi:hypothetical protein Golob_003598 [Gossypium lobatum]|uniref:SHSP domain-containing protein n=1 Tax=Gossypium lobatum TaxID=34289 RepID=A0A7J8MYZ1_9ROSI|nr:hypothetical protein [Gossypium lobatum]
MWHHVERSNGKFSRQFRLPDNAKTYKLKHPWKMGFSLLLFLRWK